MPCLSVSFVPAVGPLLQLAILPPGFEPPAPSNPVGQPGSPVSLKRYMALLDMGASCTCISAKVISDCSLTPVGKQPVGGVHGHQPTNLYQFRVGVVFSQAPLPSGIVSASIVAFPVTGAEFVPPTPGIFDVLLGRDVICRGSLALSFDGHAILCV